MTANPATPYADLSPDLLLDAVESLDLPVDGRLMAGYEDFRGFNPRELHLVEALRTLRLIHYAKMPLRLPREALSPLRDCRTERRRYDDAA